MIDIVLFYRSICLAQHELIILLQCYRRDKRDIASPTFRGHIILINCNNSLENFVINKKM